MVAQPTTRSDSLEILQHVADQRRVEPEVLNTLQHIMCAESGGNRYAANDSSTARGCFQFLNDTWLGMIQKHGEKFGLSKYASQIHRDGRGHLTIDDPTLLKEALNLRYNAQLSSEMAVIFTRENKTTLENKLSRKVTSGEIYLAHFLGAGGALHILTHSDANARIDSILPADVIDKNSYNPITGKRGVSMTRGGKSLDFRDFTVADIQQWTANKMDQELSYAQLSEQNRQASWRRRHPRQLKPGEKDDYGDMVESNGDLIPSILQFLGQLVSLCFEGAKTVIGSIITACTGTAIESPATPRQLAAAGVPPRA